MHSVFSNKRNCRQMSTSFLLKLKFFCIHVLIICHWTWIYILTHWHTHIHTHSHSGMNATNFNLVSLQSTILSDFLTFSLSFSAETWQVLLPTPIFYFIAKRQKLLSFISWDLPSSAISPLFHLVSSFRNKSTLLGIADSVYLHVHES